MTCCDGGCSWPNAHHNSLFATALVILVIVGATFLAALTVKTLMESKTIGMADAQERTISVTGTSQSEQAPDRATISIGVETPAETVELAQTQSNVVLAAMTNQLIAAGVPQTDIQTQYYNVYENETYNPVTGLYDSNGWIVYQTLSVRLDNLELVSTVLNIAGQNGATNVSGPNFEVKDQTAQKADARESAIENARMQAQEIADSLGAELGEVVSYEEWSSGMGYPVYAEDRASDLGGASIQPGTEELEWNVSITYQLVQ